MIEQLRSAGDQLRVAWDNYYHTYSALKTYYAPNDTSQHYSSHSEISSQLDTEIAFLSSYQTKIQEIRIAIGRTRNYALGLTPINSLPAEVLARIFHLVLARPCNLHLLLSSNEHHYPVYPDYLAQVCTLWRSIAISSRTLWRHIDLSPYKPLYEGLIARAETHATRAGKLPIEFHIATDDSCTPDLDELYRITPLISRRVEALELRMAGAFGGFHAGIFKQLIHQRPTLTRLAVLSDEHYSNNFIVPHSFDPTTLEGHFWPLEIDCTEAELDNIFAPINTLHLCGVFPLWSSAAYHGLTDLRLLSSKRWSQIRDTDLMVILKSSPGLQVLHFGLELCDSTPVASEISPVMLQDLQAVKIMSYTDEGPSLRFSNFLRLLKPGLKPMRLSLEDHYVPDEHLVAELERFFARSRVAMFYTRSVFLPMTTLLRHATHLEQVILDNFESNPYDLIPSTWLEVDQLTSLSRLRSLRIIRSSLFVSELRFLLECCPDDIVLYSCSVDHDTNDKHPTSISLTPSELSNTFPTLVTTDHIPRQWENPTADWDILN